MEIGSLLSLDELNRRQKHAIKTIDPHNKACIDTAKEPMRWLRSVESKADFHESMFILQVRIAVCVVILVF